MTLPTDLHCLADCACRPNWQEHSLSSYTQISSVAEPSIGSLIGSLEAEGQLEEREEKEG